LPWPAPHLPQEAGVMVGLRHPNILPLLKVCVQPAAIVTGEQVVLMLGNCTVQRVHWIG